MARRRYQRRSRGLTLGRILGWLMKSIIVFLALSFLWVLAYRFVNPPITFTMIGDKFQGRSLTRDWMSISRLDRNNVRAAIAAEDSKFCSHWGFDQDSIAAAMRRNARGGNIIRGGSTISQQTAKNAFLWQGGGYFRKGMEAWFTLLIENLWGKRRIMEVYLNLAETGIGTYGVNAGAERYFGHDAATMSRIEAARIAAVLPLPKKRGAVAPKGFTRRYGNMIASRIGTVARDGLDACIYANRAAPRETPEPAAARSRHRVAPKKLPGEEFEGQQTAAPAAQSPPPEVAPEVPPAGNQL